VEITPVLPNAGQNFRRYFAGYLPFFAVIRSSFIYRITSRLKFEVLFVTLRKSRTHHFPRRTRSNAKTVVHITGREMYLFEI